MLSIKNTKAHENREKLSTNNKNKPAFFVASCDLSKLWGGSAPTIPLVVGQFH